MPQQSRTLFSDQILNVELVYESIFDNCSAASLLRIARTCRAAHRAIAAYSRVAFDINRLLSRFFPSQHTACSSVCTMDHVHEQAYDRARAFRGLQARTGTLVSGSCALQFFDRTIYPESDLDLYVHMCHRQEVGRWLIQEGYVYEPTSHQDPNFELEVALEHEDSFWEEYAGEISSIYKVFTFKKRVSTSEWLLADVEHHSIAGLKPSEGRGELTVQLIVPKKAPMEVILGFHSTCVMNVISYDKAYCLFPQATLEERLALFTSSPSEDPFSRSTDQYRRAISKYTERGFTFIRDPRISSTSRRTNSRYEDPQAELARRMASTAIMAVSWTAPVRKQPRKARKSARRPTFYLGQRWIDDSDSWVLPLPLTGIVQPNITGTSPSSLVRDPVAICNWETRYDYVNNRVTMHFDIVEGESLRYTYILRDENLVSDLQAEICKKEGGILQMRGRMHPSSDRIYFDEDLWGWCRQSFKRALAT
ncbi:hypothetical protein C8Q73DRAFT_679801 [Cubamyces lactineus]|nr:hypothetical protein C8Q73DRAFT_679801 [Cubamyces lactineus]